MQYDMQCPTIVQLQGTKVKHIFLEGQLKNSLQIKRLKEVMNETVLLK